MLEVGKKEDVKYCLEPVNGFDIWAWQQQQEELVVWALKI